MEEEAAGADISSKLKKKRKVDQLNIHGHLPFNMKLDLNNSKWWKTGFDN